MTNEQLSKINTLARRLRLQAMLCRDSPLSEFDDEDLHELMAIQLEWSAEIEKITSEQSEVIELKSQGEVNLAVI